MPIDLAAKDISIELFSDYLTLTLGIIKKSKAVQAYNYESFS